MPYDKAYFLAKFEAIPAEHFAKGIFVEKDNPVCRCPLAHCGNSDWWNKKGGIAFDDLPEETREFIDLLGGSMWAVMDIADGQHDEFQQNTVKERILAAIQAA